MLLRGINIYLFSIVDVVFLDKVSLPKTNFVPKITVGWI